ncbi:hypothetical protein N7540_006000 [Penicillium herquei]|nr:hypothetical protein N7540_006000 [Penicillium herquei]
MTSVYNLGCFAGAVLTIWGGDWFGRTKTLVIGSVIIGLGAAIQAASFGVSQMLVGRVIAGVGMGVNTATANVWQSETSKMSSRGKLVIVQMKGQYEEALLVIAALEGNGGQPSSPSVQVQFEIIRETYEHERISNYKLMDIFSGNALQQRPPIYDVAHNSPFRYYMSYIFQNTLNMSTLMSRILAAVGSIDYFIFAALAYFTIERFGRRTVLIGSSIDCCFCWIVISIAMGIAESYPHTSKEMSILAVAFFFIFFASFGSGLLGGPWLYATEINSSELRTAGVCISTATNWIVNYMVVEITPIGIANLGSRFWIIWACICFAFVPIIYLFYPETASRTLEDIDRFFESKPKSIVSNNPGMLYKIGIEGMYI